MRIYLALFALGFALLAGASTSPNASPNRTNQTTTAKTGSESGPTQTKPPATAASATTSKARAVPLDNKKGRLLARMQTKRQTGGSGASLDGNSQVSRRNEDPWFLDQAPYPLQPYRFVYNVKGKNGQTEQYRQEVGDGKFLSGSYGYMLPDGIYRHVDYVADDRGFRAFIRTSEPGTANQNPANVVINSTPPFGYAQPDAPASLVSQQQVAAAAAAAASLPLSPQYNPTLTDYSTLPRRPPGSIVNTSLRNFTSFSFTTPSPVDQLNPLFNWNATQARADQELERVRPLPASRTESSGGWQQLGQQQAPQRPNQQQQPSNYNRFGYLGQLDTPLPPPPPAQSRRVPLEMSGRVGPDRLSYDRPLSGTEPAAKQKLLYDTSHVLHPELPHLSLERARSLEQLNQLNGLHYARPLLANVGELPATHFSAQSGHSRSEEHHTRHRESHLSHQDESGRTNSREQGGGSRVGVVHESEYHQQTGAGQLLPPPPPFQSQRPVESSGGVKGARLQAPYAGLTAQHHTEIADPPIPQPLFGPASPTPPSTPAPPRAPEEPARPEPPANSEQQQRTTPSDSRSSEPAEQPNQPEERGASRGGTKGGDLRRRSQQPGSWSPEAEQLRAARNPAEEYRTNMIMTDLRAMQNTFGLPQPPRLQRSSTAFESHAEEQLRSKSRAAEEAVAARMQRVEALLRNSQQQQSNPASASTPPRTVAASENELEPSSAGPGKAGKRKAGSPGPAPSSGTLIERRGLEPLPEGAVNETFDARRLSASRAARLQAEKVSELEKFQQRLRSQQLLLDQTKKPASSGNKTRARAGANEVNSHVKYDDQTEADQADPLGRVNLFRTLEPSQEFPRTRRDGLESEKPEGGTSPRVEPAGQSHKAQNVSDFAQQVRRWPSLSGNASEAAQSPKPESGLAPNSVSMDFINSVTSLSVSQLNPFSSGSVNPAVQRSSQLQAHRLEASAATGVATSNARYQSSPELLARVARAGAASERAERAAAPGAANWASNHQLAPYALAASRVSPAGQLAEASSSPASVSRDGFEVRDRAAKLDNYRFYEVVSSVARDEESRAFRDAQLSVPALSS